MKRKAFHWAQGTLFAVLFGTLLLTGCDQESVAAETETPGLWKLDYEAALKQAAAENKYLLVSISGLEWCHWCIRLENEVFTKPEFISYAEGNLVPVLLDFKRSGQASAQEFAAQHEQLLDRYRVQGFPTVLILNPQGKVVKRTGYQPGGAQPYVEMIKAVIAADAAN